MPAQWGPGALRPIALALAVGFGLPFAHCVHLFAGGQRLLFANIEITESCDSVLNKDIRCPESIIGLKSPDFTARWTSEKLSTFCKAECQNDLSDLAHAMESFCQEEQLSLQLGNFTLGEFGGLLSYRGEQLCLRDEEAEEGDFCLFARDSWDVPKLHESHRATWPEHTEKCLLDEAGKCGIFDLEYAFSEWGFEEYVNMPEWMFQVREAEYAAYDFITNRTGTFAAANRHSLGWETRLELDEFPLEIQCQPCFWKPLTLAYQRKWGHLAWDEWSESMWNNIVENCNITGEDATIVPWRNLTAEYPEDMARYDDEPELYWEPNWDLCPLTYTVPEDSTLTVIDLARSQNLSMACLRSFNKDFPYDLESLQGRKLCIPPGCEIEVVESMSVQSFITARSNQFSPQQFLRWNPCLNREGHLFRGDTVCVSPHGGIYEPTVISLED